jgi:hypothetical protein
MIRRETSRVLVLHLLWLRRGAKNTAREFCALTTPSFLSKGTRKFNVKGRATRQALLKQVSDLVEGRPDITKWTIVK